MTQSEQLTSSALQALLRDGTLAGNWTLDPARTEVQLHTRHTWGLRPLLGVFSQAAGTGAVTPSGEVSGVFTVAAASVDTKNARRDTHLRSADFFDVVNYPDFTFTVASAVPADGASPADGVSPADGRVRVAGQLTVRDVTRPAAFDATVSTADGEVRLDGELWVNRGDFGMTWNFIGIAAMESTIVVHAVFTRQ
jgi:polyisoprenoid-binding protein YceI